MSRREGWRARLAGGRSQGTTSHFVIPAKAGIHLASTVDSRLRGNDGKSPGPDLCPSRAAWAALVALALVALGCRQDMHDQPRLEALEESAFFVNGMASRDLPAGTVAWGHLREDTRLYEGKSESGDFIETLPVAITRELLDRGRSRYEIYCSVCHDSTGGGRGMIVRRGFKQPPPLYEQRLRDMPAGYFYDVITHGFGLMSSYATQIPVDDRWAIVAYLRALQLSQTAVLAELPAELQEEFRHALAAPAADEHAADESEGHHE